MHELIQTPPTPEELDALVERETEAMTKLAFLAESIDISEEPQFMVYLSQQLDQLSPCSRPVAETLAQGALRGDFAIKTEDELKRALQDQSFPHWLHFVVKKLAPQAQQVVIPEFWEHYHSAVEHLAQTQPASPAHEIALRQLGKRKKVARRLQRVHLTEKEVKLTTSGMPWISIFAVGIVLFSALLGSLYSEGMQYTDNFARNLSSGIGSVLIITGFVVLHLVMRAAKSADLRKMNIAFAINQFWANTVFAWILAQDFGIVLITVFALVCAMHPIALWHLDTALQRKMRLIASYPAPREAPR